MANRILWIEPVGTDLFERSILEHINKAKRPDTKVDVISLRRGPMHLEYHYYEALILADTLYRVKQAERDGYDAVVIGCFYDPGLQEAREITNQMVVTAPAESSMLIAASLGYRFSIIVGRNKWIPRMHENVVKYGLIDRLASFESVGLGVRDFQKNKQETERRLTEAAQQAIQEKLAEVIILGCTMEFGFYRALQKKLGVPVIDAILAPLKYAEFMIELKKRFNWSHSKVYGYESPPKEEIIDWKLEDQYDAKDIWA